MLRSRCRLHLARKKPSWAKKGTSWGTMDSLTSKYSVTLPRAFFIARRSLALPTENVTRSSRSLDFSACRQMQMQVQVLHLKCKACALGRHWVRNAQCIGCHSVSVRDLQVPPSMQQTLHAGSSAMLCVRLRCAKNPPGPAGCGRAPQSAWRCRRCQPARCKHA